MPIWGVRGIEAYTRFAPNYGYSIKILKIPVFRTFIFWGFFRPPFLQWDFFGFTVGFRKNGQNMLKNRIFAKDPDLKTLFLTLFQNGGNGALKGFLRGMRNLYRKMGFSRFMTQIRV